MLQVLIQIIAGLFIWKVFPEFLSIKNRNKRKFVNLCCLITGIAMVAFGTIALIKLLVAMF